MPDPESSDPAPKRKVRWYQHGQIWGVGFILLLLLTPKLLSEKAWGGSYELTVQLSSDEDSPISKLRYMTIWRQEAEWFVEEGEPFDALDNSGIEEAHIRNNQFVVYPRCGGRYHDIFGERTYSEQRFLVLLIDYEDGKEVRKLVEIPKGRGGAIRGRFTTIGLRIHLETTLAKEVVSIDLLRHDRRRTGCMLLRLFQNLRMAGCTSLRRDVYGVRLDLVGPCNSTSWRG